MTRTAKTRFSDEMRAMLRLANRLHASRDPLTRKTRLMESLCELVGAGRGDSSVVHTNAKTGEQTLVSATEFRVPAPRETTGRVADTDPAVSVLPSHLERGLTLTSSVQVPDSALTATMRMHRSAGRGTRFKPRHQALVDVVHEEMVWIYHADMILMSPEALALSPRTREILELLLADLNEKQIASKLCLSPNTVHHYVKSIHRNLRVSRRSELLGGWLGEPDEHRDAGAPSVQA